MLAGSLRLGLLLVTVTSGASTGGSPAAASLGWFYRPPANVESRELATHAQRYILTHLDEPLRDGLRDRRIDQTTWSVPTTAPAPSPTSAPTAAPTTAPTVSPTSAPTPTISPTTAPTTSPTSSPTPAYSRKATVANSVLTPGWETAKRPDAGGSELLTVAQDYTYHEAGGWQAGSHFSRLVRNLPARDNHYIDATGPHGRFIMRSKFWLPADFYTQHESYMRFFNIDNWPSKMSGSGEVVGAKDANEWRVYFGIESLLYKTPKFGVQHETNEEMTLWTPANNNANRLPTGMNEVVADFTPNTPGKTDGAWRLTINGVVVGQATGVRTMPTSLAPSERKVTTMFSGIDGAYAQSSKRLAVRVYETELIQP